MPFPESFGFFAYQGCFASVFAAEQTISEPADKLLRGLLSDLPKQVDFAEKSGGGDIVDDQDANAIAARAKAYQSEQRQAGNNISISQAVNHVTKGA